MDKFESHNVEISESSELRSDTITLVQESFKAIVPMADQVGDLFYGRLFQAHPMVRPMFPEDIRPQAKKLVQMLALVVNSLHKLDTILPAVEALARRHNDYGVSADHYPVVGETLIWTLERGLGEAFTADAREAWVNAYGALSSVMIAAARAPAASR